jgi:hypothetical protein
VHDHEEVWRRLLRDDADALDLLRQARQVSVMTPSDVDCEYM